VQLGLDLQSVLSEANISWADAQAVVDDVQELGETGGLTDQQLQILIDDLKPVFAEIESQAPLSETQRERIGGLVTDLVDAFHETPLPLDGLSSLL
jgi:hypothetical protein